MMGIAIIAGILIWAVCGILAYGLSFSYLQREFPGFAYEDRARDTLFSFVMFLGGVFGLFAVLVVYGAKNGLKYR